MREKNQLFWQGVTVKDGKVFVFYNRGPSYLSSSSDGCDFSKVAYQVKILGKVSPEEMSKASAFRISKIDGQYIACYLSEEDSSKNVCLASSKDLKTWEKMPGHPEINTSGMIVPGYKYQGQLAMYFGRGDIKLALSKDLVNWEIPPHPVISPRPELFDSGELEVASISVTNRGILLIYYSKTMVDHVQHYSLGAAIFDKSNPQNLIWRVDIPLWDQDSTLSTPGSYPVGIVEHEGKLLLYWGLPDSTLLVYTCSFLQQIPTVKAHAHTVLFNKLAANPIIAPIMRHFWESQATFNPAAIYEDDKFHLLYRAVGDNGASVLGYASSSDGFTIEERLEEPIYVPTEPFEVADPSRPFIPISYSSGPGGYGGIEDPRLTVLGKRIYMTYVAFNGYQHPGVALTSIDKKDFLNKKWNWEKPVLISRPGQLHKNWVLFPEKVNGKYAVLHAVSPKISIHYLDDLSELNQDNCIDSFDPKQYWKPEYLRFTWDSYVKGAGPPPIKTPFGWLLFYHALDRLEPHKYKLGAMLLDLKDPTKILYRSIKPILEPSEKYEYEGFKGGVVYSCGAAVKGNDLYVYYGGADTVVCVATSLMDKFLDHLRYRQDPALQPVSVCSI